MARTVRDFVDRSFAARQGPIEARLKRAEADIATLEALLVEMEQRLRSVR
jgi:hypothetical protein